MDRGGVAVLRRRVEGRPPAARRLIRVGAVNDEELDEARAGSTARGGAVDRPQPIDVGGLRRRAGPEQRRRARDLGVRVPLVVAQRGREVRLLAAREEERRAAAGLVEGVGVHALRDELLDLVDVPVPRGLVDREQRRRRRRDEERVLHPDAAGVPLLQPDAQRRAAADVGHSCLLCGSNAQ